jgi:hypothetical protein
MGETCSDMQVTAEEVAFRLFLGFNPQGYFD